MIGTDKPQLLQNTNKVLKHISRKQTDPLMLEKRAAIEVCPEIQKA